MLNKYSLRNRLQIAIIPLVLALLGVSGMLLKVNFNNFTKAKAVDSNSKRIGEISTCLHVLQLERAKTILYYGGKLTTLELEDHRKKVDLTCTGVLVATDELAELRNQVNSKGITAAAAALKISKINAELNITQGSLAKSENYEGAAVRLLGLVMLDAAKENLGKLRANLGRVLREDTSISKELLSMILGLKSTALGAIQNPAVDLSVESKQKVELLFQSEDWKRVDKAANSVLTHFENGKYGEDAVGVIQANTAVIDALATLISAEANQVSAEASLAYKRALIMLVGTLCGSLMLSLGLGLLILKISSGILYEIDQSTCAIEKLSLVVCS